MDSGPLKKSTATLVDPTGSITVVFWSDWVESVENGKSYIFTNLRIKKTTYTNELYVNTAKVGFKLQETFPFTDPLPDLNPSLMDMTTKTVEITILGILPLPNKKYGNDMERDSPYMGNIWGKDF